ncbi:MAG TPA: group III truncated hemoglobin [Flavobacteriales bacterium]|nr:group III truncated hemoglobin [Flavobacteriales bacterium]
MAPGDITTSEDIRELVERFYRSLVIDPVIGHFFVGLDLEHHLPRIAAFWEMVLLDRPGYTTNVTDVHLRLNQRIPMERTHFDRWLELFRKAVDERYTGEKAEEAKLRALSVATAMLIKVQAG